MCKAHTLQMAYEIMEVDTQLGTQETSAISHLKYGRRCAICCEATDLILEEGRSKSYAEFCDMNVLRPSCNEVSKFMNGHDGG